MRMIHSHYEYKFDNNVFYYIIISEYADIIIIFYITYISFTINLIEDLVFMS